MNMLLPKLSPGRSVILIITVVGISLWVYTSSSFERPNVLIQQNTSESCHNLHSVYIDDASWMQSDANGTYISYPGWMSHLYHQSKSSLISGVKLIERKFLSIGIATVYRVEEYLKTTLQSLINGTNEGERGMVVIVIYLADTDLENRDLQLRLIESNFQKYLNSGFIQVISSTADIYPPLDFALTRRTFNDPVDRVLWRTKQVIDFAFLFSYIFTQKMSHYHLIAEDDIISSEQYISAIQDYVELKRHKRETWTALQFSSFVGIGLLFHSRDLDRLTQFLLIFYKDQPVDLLMRLFVEIQNPNTPGGGISHRVPSTFQHIGSKSTLPNKVQALTDKSFNIARRKFKNQNPKAMKITTTMKVNENCEPSNAYSSTPGWFSGTPTQAEETFDIVYDSPIKISRIIVISGLSVARLTKPKQKFNSTRIGFEKNEWILRNFIRNGVLQISSHFIKFIGTSLNPICDNFTTIGTFDKNGSIDIRFDMDIWGTWDHGKTSLIQCVRILIRPVSKFLRIIISEIQVESSLI